MQIKIVELERALPDGVVTRTHWVAELNDGEHKASMYGSVNLPSKSQSDPTFVSFDALTEQQAVEWCRETIGRNNLDAMQAKLAAEVAKLKTPAFAVGFPWPTDQVNQPI
jgi:hypothetical protein